MLPVFAAIPPWVTGLLIVWFVFICIILILTVLIQRPAGGGLVGAFGSGAGSGQTAFGTKTGDALTIATIIMFVVYLGTAVVLNHVARPPTGGPDVPAATGTDAPENQPANTPAAEPASEQPAGDSSAAQPSKDGEPAEPAEDAPKNQDPAQDPPKQDEPPKDGGRP